MFSTVCRCYQDPTPLSEVILGRGRGSRDRGGAAGEGGSTTQPPPTDLGRLLARLPPGTQIQPIYVSLNVFMVLLTCTGPSLRGCECRNSVRTQSSKWCWGCSAFLSAVK